MFRSKASRFVFELIYAKGSKLKALVLNPFLKVSYPLVSFVF